MNELAMVFVAFFAALGIMSLLKELYRLLDRRSRPLVFIMLDDNPNPDGMDITLRDNNIKNDDIDECLSEKFRIVYIKRTVEPYVRNGDDRGDS